MSSNFTFSNHNLTFVFFFSLLYLFKFKHDLIISSGIVEFLSFQFYLFLSLSELLWPKISFIRRTLWAPLKLELWISEKKKKNISDWIHEHTYLLEVGTFTGLMIRLNYILAVNHSNAKRFSMYVSLWHPLWSIFLHMATFSTFKFTLYLESPSNNQTTAVFKRKAASFQCINIRITKHVSICSAFHVCLQ